MEKEPKLLPPILLFLAAATLVIIAWDKGPFPELEQWKRDLLILFAAILGFAAVLALVNWLAAEGADRLQQLNMAKVYHLQLAADAVRGLSGAQLDVVNRYGHLQMIGRLGESQVVWSLRTPTGEMDWGFVAAFIAASAETKGYLWPVRRHERFSDWTNSEQLCQSLTDLIVERGWAEKAGGPYPARLTVPLEDLAEFFGVEA